MHDPEIKKKYFIWLDTPPKERKPKTKAAFARQHNLTPQTLNDWEKKREKEEAENIDGDDLARQIERMDKAVYEAATVKRIAKMAELWYRRHGLLVDKSEHKVEIGFNASELARIRNEARRELEGEGYAIEGSGEVRPQPTLLSEKIRES